MRQGTVREALLKAAMSLFSQYGYNAVSMRQIAKEAHANVGSLTYHFGTKQNLLRELYILHAQPINNRRLDLLTEACRISDTAERLRAILRAYIVPAFSFRDEGEGGEAQFTRLRAILSAEGNSEANSIIAETFDETTKTFHKALATCVPEASTEDIIWRGQFLLGALYYTLINPDRITRLTQGTVDGANHEKAVDQLVASSFSSFYSLLP